MIRRQILMEPTQGVELVLPVPPASYQWEHGIHMETVNLDGLGDLVLPGYKALDTRKVECLFPAHAYPWAEPGAARNPMVYVEQIERWVDGRAVLRYIVSGTPLNAAVRIQSIQYGEQDGTNDVYATLTLRQYQGPEILAVDAGTAAEAQAARSTDTAAVEAQSYTVRAGDTLSSIARRFYGDAARYPGLAAANGIKNPSIIHVGQVLTIPAAKDLPAKGPTGARATRATAEWNEYKRRYDIQLAKEEAMGL